MVPDWIFQVLSNSSASIDWEVKMPMFARFGVSYIGLIDQFGRTLQVYRLGEGNWDASGRDSAFDQVSLAPF